MKPFGTLLSFEKATDIINTSILPVTATEKLKIDDCLNRILAEDIVANRSTPPFDRAAVDGYALKAKDTFSASRQNPVMLDVTDAVYAGGLPQKMVNAGECIQVATGAKMPRGADAVVMIENVSREGNRIKVIKSTSPGSNIAPIGEDIKKGELVLKEGYFLSPANIGVLASQGLIHASVYRKPRVAVIPTGEEIGSVGNKLKPTQIYDINSHTISAVVANNGCQPISFAISGDSIGELKETIEAGLEYDMLVFSGGSSVGERDLLFGILEEMGEVLFHGIQIKPGKPTMFAIVKGKPIFGMPGYPTSCLMNAYILLLPALRKMAHLPQKTSVIIDAELSERVPGSTGRKQFLPVRLEGSTAVPIFKESGSITGTAKANGYIVLNENVDIMEKGNMVKVTLF